MRLSRSRIRNQSFQWPRVNIRDLVVALRAMVTVAVTAVVAAAAAAVVAALVADHAGNVMAGIAITCMHPKI